MRAKSCFSSSGIIDLYLDGAANEYYFLKYHRTDETYLKWYRPLDYLKKTNIDVFYFYPSDSVNDLEQKKLYQELNRVWYFEIDSNIHGEGLTIEGWASAFCTPLEMIKSLSGRYKMNRVKLSEEIISAFVSSKEKEFFSDELYSEKTSMCQSIIYPESICLFESSVIIYGAGRRGKELFLVLKSLERQNLYIVDKNDKASFLKDIKPQERLSMNEFEKLVNKAMVVISVAKDETVKEIVAELITMGWDKSRVFRYVKE